MPKIKWIEINAFRSFGDGTERMEFSSPIAVAWGPNSQGKTSIAEAFEFLLTGTICRCELTASAQDEFADSLKNAHVSASAETFVKAGIEDLTGTTHTIKRTLTTDYGMKNRCSSRLTIDDKPAQESDLKSLGVHLSAPPLAAPILLQHTLGYLFSASPKERSMYFKALLEVADLEELRLAIADAGKSIAAGPPELAVKLQSCAAALKGGGKLQLTPPLTVKEINDAFSDTAAGLLKSAGLPIPNDPIERFSRVQGLLDSLRSKTFPLDGLAVPALNAWSPPTDSTFDDIETFLKESQKADAETKRLAKLFSEVLAIPDIAGAASPIDCPVCMTPKGLTPERIQVIRNRLTADKAYDSARRRAESSLKAIGTAAAVLVTLASSSKPKCSASKRIWRRKNNFSVVRMKSVLGSEADGRSEEWFRALVALRRAINRAIVAGKTASSAEKEFSAELSTRDSSVKLQEILAGCGGAYKALQTAHASYVGIADQIRRDLQAKIDQESALQGWEDFLDLASRQQELLAVIHDAYATDTVIKQHTKALAEIDRALEKVLEAKFSTLSSEIRAWWERLRPDEKTFFSSVKQRPKARRTVDFKVGLGKDENRKNAPLRDAVAVFSYSQLHCLGLASFLARSNRESNGFIVFDDPVVSSDEDYRAHFNSSVLDELVKAGVQVILLTQDQRTWKDVSDRYAYIKADVFQITRDTGATKVAKTSDDLLAKLAKAEPYVRSEHPALRKTAAEILRDATERLCKEMLVKSRREQGDSTAKITDYDGKTLGDLFPKVYPILKDPSHAGKLKVIERLLNPGKHDDTIPSKGELSCTLGDLKRFRQDYLTETALKSSS